MTLWLQAEDAMKILQKTQMHAAEAACAISKAIGKIMISNSKFNQYREKLNPAIHTLGLLGTELHYHLQSRESESVYVQPPESKCLFKNAGNERKSSISKTTTALANISTFIGKHGKRDQHCCHQDRKSIKNSYKVLKGTLFMGKDG